MDLSTGTSTDPFYLVKDDIQASVSVPARNFCLAKKMFVACYQVLGVFLQRVQRSVVVFAAFLRLNLTAG